MKTLIFILFIITGLSATGQTPNVKPSPAKDRINNSQSSRQNTSPLKSSSRPVSSGRANDRTAPIVSPRSNTRPSSGNRTNAGNNSSTGSGGNINAKAAPKSPFAGGIQAAPNAARTYDTITNNRPANTGTVGTIITGGNDTTFNVNTLNNNGVGTNSGAVDRSGQSQFGQTNWGRNDRNTVGESQWTIPPPITASFSREFPAQSNVAWMRSRVDTNTYDVRFKSGANWVTSVYDATGNRINMRTEVPLQQPPTPVSSYMGKQPANIKIVSINRFQMQGRPEVFELKLSNGETTYVNNDGIEIKF